MKDESAMKYVVIRDDDVSYFTNPATLEKLYAPLIVEKKPINFALIPRITANIKTDANNPYNKQENLEYDPIIPPEHRGYDKSFPLGENKNLVEFIQSLEFCEVLQHGFTHGFIDGVKEFRIRDEKVLQQRASLGREILQKCFHANPSFFVAPWDNVSSEAINFFKSSYKGLSMGRINPVRLPAKSCGSYLRKMLSSRNFLFYESLLIVEHPGYILTRFNNPESILNKVKAAIETRDVVILVNHHWEYFYDWNGLDSSFFSAWNKVMEYLLQKENLKIITFSELYDLLKDRKV